tara:strand:+ start:28 stop:252 length:225 start_codon:yes stop_codon:yes gene_type:complete
MNKRKQKSTKSQGDLFTDGLDDLFKYMNPQQAEEMINSIGKLDNPDSLTNRIKRGQPDGTFRTNKEYRDEQLKK